MGNIDAVTKDYLSQNDVFADAFNFMLYDGENVIKPESLHELDTAEIMVPYGTDKAGEPVQKYRDVLKAAVGMHDEKAAYLILGIESQSNINYGSEAYAL